ncbi:MAG: hypothetical protein NTX86_04455 [Candidatus Dependentiae bacterium]|nr:hypothetical protein [Candidatus Dependentiae bacterium]
MIRTAVIALSLGFAVPSYTNEQPKSSQNQSQKEPSFLYTIASGALSATASGATAGLKFVANSTLGATKYVVGKTAGVVLGAAIVGGGIYYMFGPQIKACYNAIHGFLPVSNQTLEKVIKKTQDQTKKQFEETNQKIDTLQAAIQRDIASLDIQIKQCATKEDVAKIETELKRVHEKLDQCATKDDSEKLKKELQERLEASDQAFQKRQEELRTAIANTASKDDIQQHTAQIIAAMTKTSTQRTPFSPSTTRTNNQFNSSASPLHGKKHCIMHTTYTKNCVLCAQNLSF